MGGTDQRNAREGRKDTAVIRRGFMASLHPRLAARNAGGRFGSNSAVRARASGIRFTSVCRRVLSLCESRPGSVGELRSEASVISEMRRNCPADGSTCDGERWAISSHRAAAFSWPDTVSDHASLASGLRSAIVSTLSGGKAATVFRARRMRFIMSPIHIG